MDELTTAMNMDQISGLMAGGLIGAVLGSLATLGALIRLVYWILNLIGCWKIFGKFGEPGWKCLIPFYNTWLQYKYTWKSSMAIWVWGLSLVGQILYQVFTNNDNLLLALISGILCIAAWVLSLIGYHKLSKAFGHGAGYTVGLILVTGIFQMILGFGSSQYIGNTYEQDKL